MDRIIELLLVFIAGCVYMMRGGSSQFSTITRPFGNIDSESGKPNAPRWATVALQLIVITPVVLMYHLSPWIILAYPIGWFLTIMSGWGKIYDCKTWKKRALFFGRMCHSAALLVPLALLSGSSLLSAAIHTAGFAALTVVIYTLYNKQEGHTDESFNWSEFLTGSLLAITSFHQLGIL